MRPVLLLVATLVLAAPAARAQPTLLLSASIQPRASGILAGSCPVVIQLRNLERQPVSMIGRFEGTIGDSDFPSYRTFAFDNVPPGRAASTNINFDGDCSHAAAPGQSRGELTLRGLLMCHKGLTNYFNCQHDIATEPSAAAIPLTVTIDITDWDPGGLGTTATPKSTTNLPFTGAPPR